MVSQRGQNCPRKKLMSHSVRHRGILSLRPMSKHLHKSLSGELCKWAEETYQILSFADHLVKLKQNNSVIVLGNAFVWGCWTMGATVPHFFLRLKFYICLSRLRRTITKMNPNKTAGQVGNVSKVFHCGWDMQNFVCKPLFMSVTTIVASNHI